MTQPRTHVMITGGARITSLTAEVEAGEVSNVKYLASCYKRATEECKKWKVNFSFDIQASYLISQQCMKSVEGIYCFCFSALEKVQPCDI